MSKVDIVIPCYNYGKFLKQCVDSVLSQNGVEVRIIIMDDASPDNTPEICKELASNDNRIEFYRNPVNLGHIATYNEGLKKTKSDYALLLSADDLLIPGALSRAVKLLDANPKVNLCYGKEIYFESGEPLPTVPDENDDWEVQVMPSKEFLWSLCRAGENFISTATAVVRTSAQHRVGGYRAEFPHSGDLEMWLRFGAIGDVGFVDKFQAFSRRHGNNMRLSYLGVKDFVQLKAAFDSVFNEYGATVDDMNKLKNTAYRSISIRAIEEATKFFEKKSLAESKELQEFSKSVFPHIVGTRAWRNLTIRYKLGPVWPLLKPIYSQMKRMFVASVS